jgi:hypothetical protein
VGSNLAGLAGDLIAPKYLLALAKFQNWQSGTCSKIE